VFGAIGLVIGILAVMLQSRGPSSKVVVSGTWQSSAPLAVDDSAPASAGSSRTKKAASSSVEAASFGALDVLESAAERELPAGTAASSRSEPEDSELVDACRLIKTLMVAERYGEALSELAQARKKADSDALARLEFELRHAAATWIQAVLVEFHERLAEGAVEQAARLLAQLQAKLGDEMGHAALAQAASELAEAQLATECQQWARQARQAEDQGRIGEALVLWRQINDRPGLPSAWREQARDATVRLNLRAVVAAQVGAEEAQRLAHQLVALHQLVQRWVYGAEQPSVSDRAQLAALAPSPRVIETLLAQRAPSEKLAPGIHTLTLKHERFDDVAFLALPAGHDPLQALPLVVYLHGTANNVDDAKTYAEYMAQVSQGRYLALVPHTQHPASGVGFGPSRHGIDPVFDAIDTASRKVVVDPDAVSLTGQSMGGHAAWNIGMQYADRFSALGPKSGAAVHPWQRGLYANLQQTPMLVIHGAKDDVVPIALARQSVASARQAGVIVDFKEFPLAGHEGADWETIGSSYRWLAAQRRVRYPRELRYATRYAYRPRSGWLRIDRFDEEWPATTVKYVAQQTRQLIESVAVFDQPAVLAARADPDTNTIHVLDVAGVAACTVFIHPALVDPECELTIKSRQRVIFRGLVKVDVAAMLDRLRVEPWRPPYWAELQLTLSPKR
jgi:dienelactone hydrolase